jgi:two-component system CheB/CheR fusion protein
MLALQNTTIVIVEDHSEIRFPIAVFLKRLGAKVFTASDASEGLWTIRATRPNVVLVDIQLPDQDGYELLRDIRAVEGEGSRVPVIAMTAYPLTFGRTSTLGAGFQEQLIKPFSPGDLLRVIESVLRP